MAGLLWKEFSASHSMDEFESIEDLNQAMGEWIMARNSRPLDDFSGLSPEQVGRLLDDFFDVVTVAERVSSVPPAVPFLVLDALLDTDMGGPDAQIDELPDRPLKLAMSRSKPIDLFLDLTDKGRIRLLDLSFLVLRTAGIVRRYRGRFIIGREFRARVEKRDYGALYPLIFKTLCTRIPWGIPMPHTPIEPFFGFLIYLLYRKNGADCSMADLLDPFYLAFPMIVDDFRRKKAPDEIDEELAIFVFHASALVSFFGLLGLVEDLGADIDLWLRPHPALQEIVSFPPSWLGIHPS